MKQVARIAFLYSVFAALATLANLATQALVVWLYRGAYAIEISILAGTAAGLPIKYVLEKRHIFGFRADNLAHDGRLFFLYSFMGVFTTLLFWGTEYAFHRLFGTDAMRYLGGAIGLTLGYAIKYHLAACRAFHAGCVGRLGGWMQGASRREWSFHSQAAQRRRRRPDAQLEGPGALLAGTVCMDLCVAALLFGITKRRFAAPGPAPKSPPAHPRGKPDRLLDKRFVFVARAPAGAMR